MRGDPFCLSEEASLGVLSADGNFVYDYTQYLLKVKEFISKRVYPFIKGKAIDAKKYPSLLATEVKPRSKALGRGSTGQKACNIICKF
jgi:hypothetical protein